MKTARSSSIPCLPSVKRKKQETVSEIQGKWKEVLSRSERLSTGKNSDLQGIEYETYTLSRREWVLYGAEGILLAAVLDYVFYRSFLLILLIFPAGILFPLATCIMQSPDAGAVNPASLRTRSSQWHQG